MLDQPSEQNCHTLENVSQTSNASPSTSTPLPLTIYSHNILANTWVSSKCSNNQLYYDKSLYDKGLLHAPARHKLSLEKALNSNADIICFQEVGLSEAVALWSSELARSYHITGFVDNAVTSGSEPNGVVVLLRRGVMDPNYRHVGLQLNGTTAASLVHCRRMGVFGHPLLIISCHLDWGDEGTLQAYQLMQAIEAESKDDATVILWCGDFNKVPQTSLMKDLRVKGYRDAFGFKEELFSCGCSRRPSRIDYILYKGPVRLAEESICPAGFSGTTLCNASLMGAFRDLEELLAHVGSDHVPLSAAFVEGKGKGKGKNQLGKGKMKGRGKWRIKS